MADHDPPPPAAPPDPAATSTNLPVPVARAASGGVVATESFFSRVLRTLFGWKAGSIRADLAVVLEAATPGETGFSPEERTMLKNILRLRELRVEDVMVPRADIVSVQKNIALGDLITLFERAGHSRLVVYDNSLDDPVGMVHIRDLIAYMAAQAAVDPAVNVKRKKPFPANLDLKAVDLSSSLAKTKIARSILFVPPSMTAIELLAKMQATRIHLALVIDEYGGTDGLVSIEDIVEQIVGEIDDEHDDDNTASVVRQADGVYLADARASLEDVRAAIDPSFDVGDVAEEVDTLGGFLVMQVGRVPVRGEVVPGPGEFEFEVLDADPRRVKRVKIYRSKNRPPRRDGRRRADESQKETARPDASPS